MKKNIVKNEMVVLNTKVNILNIDNQEYISLTDLARYAHPEEPKIYIYN